MDSARVAIELGDLLLYVFPAPEFKLSSPFYCCTERALDETFATLQLCSNACSFD